MHRSALLSWTALSNLFFFSVASKIHAEYILQSVIFHCWQLKREFSFDIPTRIRVILWRKYKLVVVHLNHPYRITPFPTRLIIQLYLKQYRVNRYIKILFEFHLRFHYPELSIRFKRLSSNNNNNNTNNNKTNNR